MGSGKRQRVIESLRHAYSDWQWRSAAVWAAYERWSHGCGTNPALDFAAYRVALDMEERACRHYMELAQGA